MAKYKCNNKECKAFEEEVEERETWVKYTSDGPVDMKASCPHCGQTRELTVPNKESTGKLSFVAFGGNGNICKK